MSRHDDLVSLRQMRDHAREAVSLSQGKTIQDLEQERVLSLALIRLLEVTGEAANRISPESRSQFPKIPWVQIIGLRNRLIHGYDSIDMEILGNILQEDLPFLIVELNTILAGSGD
jgi:uncharacterized protein with HEPN domain